MKDVEKQIEKYVEENKVFEAFKTIHYYCEQFHSCTKECMFYRTAYGHECAYDCRIMQNIPEVWDPTIKRFE